MRSRVLQEDLLKGLTIASRFVSSRAQLPVLSNILISAEKGGLKLAATNLETGIVLKIGAKIETEGAITIPAKTIVELVSHLSSGQIDLEVKEETLYITNNSANVQLSGVLATEFPVIPSIIENVDLNIDSSAFISIKNQVVYAAADDTTRPVLTGVFLVFSKGVLKAVSTDGFRLSSKELSIESKKEDKLLIPARLIDDLCRIIGESKEPVQISLLPKTKQVLFGVSNIVLTGRLLEGEFPAYEKIVPKDYIYKVQVGKEELVRAVKLAGVIARESSNIIKFKTHTDGISLNAESQQYGREQIKVEGKVEGGEVEIAFNYRFVQEFLNSVTGQEVVVESGGASAPAVFRDPKDSGYFHLIMPVRLQE